MHTLTREALYDLVWSEPGTHVARRFGVSDVAVAKWCRRTGVPRPPAGYWARLRAGRAASKASLPALRADQEDAILLKQAPACGECGGELPQPPPFLELVADPIPVSDRLRRAHPLVRATRAAYRSTRGRSNQVLMPEGNILAVQVSKAQLDRALRIMDALLKQIEALGWEVGATSRNQEWGSRRRMLQTTVGIGQVQVPISLREMAKTATRKVATGSDRPPWEPAHRWVSYPRGTGKLWLRAGHLPNFGSLGPGVSDGRTLPLERRLNLFVCKFLAEAERLRLKKVEDDECCRREEEERRRREEEARRAEEERRRRNHLEGLATRWARSQELGAFLAAAEAVITAAGRSEHQPQAAWLEWARGYVGGLDPLNLQGMNWDELSLDAPSDEEDEDGEEDDRTFAVW